VFTYIATPLRMAPQGRSDFPFGRPTVSPDGYTGPNQWVGDCLSKMAAKALDLTDPKRPLHIKISAAQALKRALMIDWIVENVSFVRLQVRPANATPVERHNIRKPIEQTSTKLEPNIDRRLGVKFEDPAARAMLKTPQLNKVWMGGKQWLACD
jgi:hypothetical protein